MKLLKIQNSGQFALVDDEDYQRLSIYKWYTDGRHKVIVRYTPQRRRISLANTVMQDYKSMFDHKNVNSFDNQKINLRPCTYLQNAKNYKKTNKPCSSKYKGVSWRKDKNKWQASICVNYKSMFLGLFHNEMLAAVMYNLKAIELHKEFANLNKL